MNFLSAQSINRKYADQCLSRLFGAPTKISEMKRTYSGHVITSILIFG